MDTSSGSVDTTITILNQLREFYETEFNHLLILATAIVTFFGLLIPYAISYIQKRQIKLAQEELEKQLTSKIENAIRLSSDNVKQLFQTELISLKTAYDNEMSNMRKQTITAENNALGKIHHVQALLLDSQGRTTEAVTSSLTAIRKKCLGGNMEAMDATLYNLVNVYIPKLKKTDFNANPELYGDIRTAVDSLKTAYPDGKYSKEIEILMKAHETAK